MISSVAEAPLQFRFRSSLTINIEPNSPTASRSKNTTDHVALPRAECADHPRAGASVKLSLSNQRFANHCLLGWPVARREA
jgi:hypothetical protein